MATIKKRQDSKGNTSFTVLIRKKGLEVCKTFYDEEEANLYIWYKERLIQEMENYESPIHERISLKQIFEMKIQKIDPSNFREINGFDNTCKRFLEFFKSKFFLHQISFNDWKECLDNFLKNEKNMRDESKNVSMKSIRKFFAYASSCFSNAIENGINLENHPLKILQLYINPKLKNEGNHESS